MTLGEESEVRREKLTFHISPITSHKSSSTPGGGTIISEPGSAADKVARIHSTAGGSPCTSTIFFGANFFAYATSASRVACALNWNCSMLQRTRCGGFLGSRATSPPVPAARRRPAGGFGVAEPPKKKQRCGGFICWRGKKNGREFWEIH